LSQTTAHAHVTIAPLRFDADRDARQP